MQLNQSQRSLNRSSTAPSHEPCSIVLPANVAIPPTDFLSRRPRECTGRRLPTSPLAEGRDQGCPNDGFEIGLAIAGKTFRYTESGQLQGLAGNKHVILAIARGGFYGLASPARSMEHAETYLRSAFSFIGVTNLDVIEADGLKVSAEQRQRAIAQAEQRIAQTIATLTP